jgi:hypothetical protein
MPIPLACDMSAIPTDERGAHHAIAQRLMPSATVVRDLVDGLAFQWPATAYVRLTGPEGTTAFLRAELQLPPA